MTTIAITRDSNGKLVGAGQKDQAAYARLKKRLAELVQGECLFIDVWFDRTLKMQGWHFIMLSAVWDAQEQFSDLRQFREWVQVGAGHCLFVPGPTGKMVAISKSISFSEIDEEEFKEHHHAVVAFLRSLHATRFLFPHLSDTDASEIIESVLRRVEQDRKRVLAERKERGE